MQELFTNKIFIESKILVLIKFILIAALLIFFLPLLILPFFNHSFTDDYFCGYQLNNKGFIPYQLFIYTNWGGRFAATFAGSLFVYNNFLYSHYYLHSLLLLILNFSSIFFLVNTSYKYLLKEQTRFSKKIILSLLFLALEICCLPQVSTFVFWFSSAITYQLPVILIQVEIALFILFFNSVNKALKIICTILLPLLIFISIGFNEFFIVVQLLLILMAYFFKWHKKCFAIFTILIVFAFLTSSALLIFSPGNHIRVDKIVPKKIYIGVVAVAYHSFETIWNIFKTPFFWFTVIAVFLYANQIKVQWQNNLYIKKIAQQKWLLPGVIFIFLVTSVSLPVAALKGGIIPDRYLNAVAYFIVPLLLVNSFMLGVSANSNILVLPALRKKLVIYLLLFTGVLFNNYIINAYKSIIIAPTYHIILSKRENILKQAAHKNKVATVNDYNTAISALLQTKYKSGTATFQQLIQQKPPLLFFEDDLATKSSIDVLKEYYRLDTIVVKDSCYTKPEF